MELRNDELQQTVGTYIWAMTPFGFPRLFVDGKEVVLACGALLGEVVVKWLVDTQPQFQPFGQTHKQQALDVLSRYAEQDDPYALISMSKDQVERIRSIRELSEYNVGYIDYALERMHAIKRNLCLFITVESGMYKTLVETMERLATSLYILRDHGENHTRQPAAYKDAANRWVVLDLSSNGGWDVTRWNPDFRWSKSEWYQEHGMALAVFESASSDFGDNP